MKFEALVSKIPEIRSCFQPGLRGLGRNSGKIEVSNSRGLDGSVNLDECTKKIYPSQNRWDYIVGYQKKIYFFEIHPASSSHIDTMINKKKWLMDWVNKNGKIIKNHIGGQKAYQWIATGRVGITRNSSQARKLAQNGITFPNTKGKLP